MSPVVGFDEVGEHVEATELVDGAVDALGRVTVAATGTGATAAPAAGQRRDGGRAQRPVGIDHGDAYPVERCHVSRQKSLS